jgi:SpoVK/Ycf46/Vps4 family AAA+-type ATPase
MSGSDDFSRLQDLALRVEPRATWNNLAFLPKPQLAVLRDIAAHARQNILDDREAAGGAPRGPALAALFSGPGGTGKTMAAEALASDLGLDLYRIDLRAVVSRYIGETEKNLAPLFDAAEKSAAILFFDEADALFGKRSEVKDSHDRYGNIEVNDLLSRMERVRGLMILATERDHHLDQDFLRRTHYRVDFAGA